MKSKDVVKPQGTDHRYHINSKGVYAECKAKVRPCPFGGAAAHFNNIDEAMRVADDLNNRLQKLNGEKSTFGIVTYEKDGEIAIVRTDKDVKNSILQFANTKSTLERLDNIRELYRQQVLEELKAQGIKSIDVDGIAKVTTVVGHEKTGFDAEKFKQLVGEKNVDHFKSEDGIPIKARVEIGNSTTKEIGEKFETAKKLTNVLGLTLNKDNNTISLSEEGRERLQQFITLQEKIKEISGRHKELNEKLTQQMKDLKLSKIAIDNYGKPRYYSRDEIANMVYEDKGSENTCLSYRKEYTRKDIDQNFVKENHPELFEKATTTKTTDESLRITPKKTKLD